MDFIQKTISESREQLTPYVTGVYQSAPNLLNHRPILTFDSRKKVGRIPTENYKDLARMLPINWL